MMAIDAALRGADVALDWLDKHWLSGLSGDPAVPDDREVPTR